MADQGELQARADEAPIYQVRLDLQGAHPPIWRRLLLPSDLTLDVIHDVIQAAMGWLNEHLHAFTSGDQEIGDPSLGEWGLGIIDEQDVTLDDVLEKVGDKLKYEYDFGDSWHHVLKLEKILPVDPDEEYPICVKGKRACPPEDVGGIWGYQNFLDAMADETHPDHDMMMEWVGGTFDPEDFDPDETTQDLREIVRFSTLRGPTLHPLTTTRWEMMSPGVNNIVLQTMPSTMFDTGPRFEYLAAGIEAAESVNELLDLIPSGVPQLITAWLDRLTSFGPDSAPIIAERLVEPRDALETDYAWVQERLACALQRLGPPAVSALLDVFDRLDLYGKAVACVALGQLGARESSDSVWATFEQTFSTPENGDVLGPMWALIDLGDPRAADAVAMVLEDGWDFNELLAMAGHVGDRRALVPLIQWVAMDEAPPESQVGSALTLVAHRIGRGAIIAELLRTSTGRDPTLTPDTLGQIADMLLSRSVDEAEAAFITMFRPITVAEAMAQLGAMSASGMQESWRDGGFEDEDWGWDDDEAAAPDDEAADDPKSTAFASLSHRWPGDRSQPRPARNDPCWCGSGKKYKDCHWRADQQKDIPQAA